MGKNFIVENLRLLFQDVNTVNIDRFGSLRDWINEANDEGYWNQLVKCLLHPDMPIPEKIHNEFQFVDSNVFKRNRTQ